MNWLQELHDVNPIAHAVLVLSLVATLGMALGNLKIRGIGLGVAGVLFSGILFGHLHLGIDHTILEFVRDFGLVLFVYTVGLQVGPGFFTSLRKEGVPLNLMAAAIVLLGAVCAIGAGFIFKIDMAAAVGLFSGATTNTPSLGAAQQALKGLASLDPARLELPALGYAVAYPFGIVGIIFSMVFLRAIFRVNPQREADAFRKEHQNGDEHLERMNLEVENENLNGVAIRDLPGKKELLVNISRIQFAGEDDVHTAWGDMPLHVGDRILAVGTKENLEKFRLIIGRVSTVDLLKAPGDVTFRRVVVTRREALGKSVKQIGFNEVYGVTVTRVVRAGVEMPASSSLRLQFGDVLQVVGEESEIAHAAAEVGNSSKALNHTNFIAVFVGIAIGILAGVAPIHFAGVPVPVRLGVAGGPLLAAIFLSRIGRIGPVVWYMPDNANVALRELGIILFLACVGLKAGEHFVEIILRGDGVLWMGCAAAITLLPLLIVGVFGRLVMKMNFMNLCGLLAGSMTDPPALAFANSTAGSDAPALAYAAVYPLTMLLRIVVAQLLVLIFVH
jgi:putative transport protein